MVYEATKAVDDMVVQVVSQENILPTSPTPDHLRKYKLSVFDQTQAGVYVGLMLFYINHETSNLDSVILERSKRLKKTLSETLDKFYPFAGKVRDDFHIDCNDEGVYYIETRVDQIKKCKAEISDDFVEAIKGDAGTPVILKIAEMMMNASAEASIFVMISSVCNMGVYELDFGWGTPIWFYYANISHANLIALCETKAGGGIQALVSLTEKEMTIFENDPELLSYASLNPALL